LLYAALSVPPFRSVKLRKRRAACPACGTEGQRLGKIEDVDYVQFCGGARPDWETLGLNLGDGESRITASVGIPIFPPSPSLCGPNSLFKIV
jgi:adenylyltransferase/sulfurtransferase